MDDRRHLTTAEILAICGTGILLMLCFVWFAISTRVRLRDEQRIADIQSLMSIVRVAPDLGLFLCSADGVSTCVSGSRVSDCAVVNAPCGRDGIEVSVHQRRVSEMRDPVYRSVSPCAVTSTSPCEYAFSSYVSPAEYTLLFWTEGARVAGVPAGHLHQATANGINN